RYRLRAFHLPALPAFSSLYLHDALPIFTGPNELTLLVFHCTLYSINICSLALLAAVDLFGAIEINLVPFRLPTLPFTLPTRSLRDRKSTRLNSSHVSISYAVFCLKKKNT